MTAMPVRHQPATTFMLAHPCTRTGYTFAAQDDGTVTVTRTDRRSRLTYTLDADEARAMWRRLRSKGYERF